MFFNIISILTCNRYDSCFNAVTHIYNVFPGIIKHLPSWTKYLEVKKYWLATSICLHSIWVFSNTFLFPKILSLKSFFFFCRISVIIQSFAEKNYICLRVSWSGNVMACTIVRIEGDRTPPLIFLQPPSPFPLNSENCLPLPRKIRFFSEPP